VSNCRRPSGISKKIISLPEDKDSACEQLAKEIDECVVTKNFGSDLGHSLGVAFAKGYRLTVNHNLDFFFKALLPGVSEDDEKEIFKNMDPYLKCGREAFGLQIGSADLRKIGFMSWFELRDLLVYRPNEPSSPTTVKDLIFKLLKIC